MQTGTTVKITKGSNAWSAPLTKGTTMTVRSMRTDDDGYTHITLAGGNRVVTGYVRYAKHLSRPVVRIAYGDGINFIEIEAK